MTSLHDHGQSPRAGTAIARTSFFVLYSVFKEHRAEGGCSAPELDSSVGSTPERDPPAQRTGCLTCSILTNRHLRFEAERQPIGAWAVSQTT
jgi:hypothetical protein